MTAVLEVGQEAQTGNGPTESQLLDVLYEVLAQGVPAKGTLTLEEVQSFLHEHARAKKSVSEMLTFFNRHQLPTDAAAYGADPALGELASGLHRERGPISATFSLDGAQEPVPAARQEGSGPIRRIEAPVEVEDTSPRARAPQSSRLGRGWIIAASLAALATAGLGVALWMTHQQANALELSLTQARLQQRSTDGALTDLERRAETLRSELSESEGQRRALAERFDEFVTDEAQKRAAEDAALQRLLGPRFEQLRSKAMRETAESAAP